MSDAPRPKPLPARPPTAPPAAPPPPAPPPVQEAATAHVESPPAAPEEVAVVGRDGQWIARVLGRSGRAAARSAPLLLLGFRRRESASEVHALEATVAARRLADLGAEALETALARAKPPPPPGGQRPFFEEADATRRSGPSSEY